MWTEADLEEAWMGVPSEIEGVAEDLWLSGAYDEAINRLVDGCGIESEDAEVMMVNSYGPRENT